MNDTKSGMSREEPWTFAKLSPRNRTTVASVTASPIVSFYDATTQAQDHHGRSLDDILQWDNATLESCHNYIQTLFPLPETSGIDMRAPCIDQATIQAFRSRKDLQAQLRRSLNRMLDFYGFMAVQEQNDSNAAFIMRIVRAPHWQEPFKIWVVSFNHNHLRITRILRCLRLLGLENESRIFFNALKAVFEDPVSGIGDRSVTYWNRASKLPLYVKPEGGEIEWLKALDEK